MNAENPAPGPAEEPADRSDGTGADARPPGGADAGGPQPAGEEREGPRGRRQRPFWKELPLLVGVALVLSLLIKTFLVQAFSIPSDSMQNTLQRGDRVLVDKLTPWFGGTPERGEVVVFKDPGSWLPEPAAQDGPWAAVQRGLSFIGLMPSADDQHLIKRVIAVGGDTVECQENGPVIVNGTPVDEQDFIYPGDSPCQERAFGPITVPEGRLWVMGDHRGDSQDSRFHMAEAGGGTVSEDDVVGRAIVVAWPVNRWATLPVPDGYDALGAASAAGAAAVASAAGPAALGLAGALPLVLWRRRRAASRT